MENKMTDEKKLQIKEVLLAEWDNFQYKNELAAMVVNGFIFGKYAENEHYSIDEVYAIVQEIELEKNPPEVIEGTELPSEV